MAATSTLVSTRYFPPSTVIGQIIRPAPANLDADARVPAYIGRGSRLALGEDLAIRRSFIFAKQLAFPIAAPFVANLEFAADGSKDAPTRLFKQDGSEVRQDLWDFVSVAGEFTQVIINSEAFDGTATYYLDYQSTDRTVQDPLPVTEIRQISNVGNTEGQDQYRELTDYFLNFSVSAPVADPVTTNLLPELEAIISTPQIGSTGTAAYNVAADYTHSYNRSYEITCTGIAGVSPTRTATFEWTATPQSAGNEAAPAVPIEASEAAPTFTIDEATPASLIVDLEYGIKLDFDFGGTHFVAGDLFQLNALGPALMEKDPRFDNTNQYPDFSPIVKTDGGLTTTSVITINDLSAYTGTYNLDYTIKCIATAGVSPNRTADFVWSEHGNTFVNGAFTVDEAVIATTMQTLSKGVIVDMSFGATHFDVGDTFTFTAEAPRIYYQAKDTRELSLEVQSTVSNVTDGTIQGQYVGTTPEAGFGLFQTTASLDRTSLGLIELPGNLKIFARNLFKAYSAGSRIVTGDLFKFSAINEETLDWSLNLKVTKEYEDTEIINDVLGTVTGSPNSFYIVLPFVPIPGSVVVKDADTLAIISSTEVTGTAYVSFLTNPSTALEVSFVHRGGEPDPGQVYYLTGLFLRPDDLYDNPQLVLSRLDGQTLLAPSSAENHLYIMNEIAFDHNTPGAYYIQVKDIDGDGIYTDVDFQRAILATEAVSRITDRIVLSNFSSLGDQLAVNLKANDPFEKRESLDWFGMPIGTPIGSEDVQNSLVFVARRTLQVYGNSPSHGTRILHGATWCKKTIQLDDGSTQQVTLDGSFVAGALAALTASFSSTAETLLRKFLIGFDEIQTYSEPENLILGSKQIIFFTDQGSSIFRIEEDITVDSFAEEFMLISAMTQKQAVTRIVRRELDAAVISVVTPSKDQSIQLIKAALGGILVGLVSRNTVASYQNEDGTVRKFDPESDVAVFAEEGSNTTFRFYYSYWLRYPIKRMIGLFLVDSNDFGF